MSVLIDSYSETNGDVYYFLMYSIDKVGQSFEADGRSITSCKFYLRKTGTPAGNAQAVIYAHTGTFGTGGTPTGAVLATSDNLDISTISDSTYALYTFTFSGTERITLTNGTKYFLVITAPTTGDVSNYVRVVVDFSSPTADGNAAYYASGSWQAQTDDCCFYVYGDYLSGTVTTQAVSALEETTLTGNGNITAIGSTNATTRGFCYKVGSSGDPTTSDSTAYDSGSYGTGAYTKGLTGLLPGTAYRVRAYIINTGGTSYGTTVNTITKPNPPTGLNETNLTKTTATLNWTAPASGSVTGYYCRYQTGSYPTSYTDGTEGTVSGTHADITGLTAGVTYYYRVWSYKTDSPNTGGVCDTPAETTFTTADFTNPTNAYSEDGSYATTPGTDGKIYVSLSKDGGTNYTAELYETFNGTNGYQTYGNGETELWGTTFTGDDVDDTSFRLKINTGGDDYQIYKTFGFAIAAGTILTGVEVKVKAKWVTATTSIDDISIKIYYGSSTLPIGEGSQAYASDGRKAGEGAGSGSGVLVFYDGTNWIACDTGATVDD